MVRYKSHPHDCAIHHKQQIANEQTEIRVIVKIVVKHATKAKPANTENQALVHIVDIVAL